jgi:acetyl-CoA acetyltransferase
MRPVYMLSGGITKFAKAHPDKDFRLMVKEALDAALADLGGRLTVAETWSVNDVYFVPLEK